MVELVELPRRENRLRSILAPLIPLYDYVFIDCPPSLDLLTVNGLCACDTVLIPIQCEYYALEGLSELMNTLKIVRKNTTITWTLRAWCSPCTPAGST